MKAKLSEDRQEATSLNDVWAMNFVHDQLATGKKLRVLIIFGTHSRYCPAADRRFSFRGEDVVQTLERVCGRIGYPKMIRVDNGQRVHLPRPRFMGLVTLIVSRLGKPTNNVFIKAFNRKLRAECLNAPWFLSFAEPREKLDDWRRYYYELRPHSAIGYYVPIPLQNSGGVASPSPCKTSENFSPGSPKFGLIELWSPIPPLQQSNGSRLTGTPPARPA